MDIREARKQFDLILSANDAATSENNGTTLHENNNIDIKEEHPQVDDELLLTIETSPRKRRRKGPVDGVVRRGRYIGVNVMKLYDRSINLDALRYDTSLYEACREWMRNDPTSVDQSAAVSPARDNRVVTCYDDVDTSPYPTVVQPPRSETRSILSSEPEMDIATLKASHIKHWKEVSKRWQHAYAENYHAHKECVNFIKSVYQPVSGSME